MSVSAPPSRARFELATEVLRSARDIVDGRPVAGPPRWVVERGWQPFLEGLDDATLARLERAGLAAEADSLVGIPDDLRALSASVRTLTALARSRSADELSVNGQRASLRKRGQVATFVEMVRPLAEKARRVVDVGSGHGHLTRHLARKLEVPVEGWELDAARLAVAKGLPGAAETHFRAVDAARAVSELAPGDLVIGLHACGELADHAVAAAASAGAGVALVGCCLQKRRGDRPSLATGEARDTLSREVLGLGNVALGEQGVEEPLLVRLRSRTNRIALRLLLVDAGIATAPGEEMRGLNRRRAVGSLDDLVEAAFARRELRAPTSAALREAAAQAETLHGSLRRYDLPRLMLGRPVELWVAEDRAAHLANRGRAAWVELAFDEAESPRNLAIVSPGEAG